jgi:site-specific DNA-methyltransferase (adenine-specific)
MEFMAGLEDNAYELAIVDPPYGIGLCMVYDVGCHDNIHSKKQWNDAAPLEEYFKELHRISKNQIIWGCNYYAQFIPAIGRIVHDKIMSCEKTAFNFSHADIASCSMQSRITMFRYEWSGNRQGGSVNWNNTGTDARIHPTQKPVALYKWLLQKYANPGDKILDTHGGSGSICIACYDMGYDLDWMELDADYYRDAVQRYRDHAAQGKLLEPAPAETAGEQLSIPHLARVVRGDSMTLDTAPAMCDNTGEDHKGR